MAIAPPSICIATRQFEYPNAIYCENTVKSSSITKEQQHLVELVVGEVSKDKLCKYLQAMNEIDLKFSCNGIPFISYLAKQGRYETLNIILIHIERRFPSNPLAMLESECFDISSVFFYIFSTPKQLFTHDKRVTVSQLIRIGVDITQCEFQGVNPLALLLTKDFDGATSLREEVISQLLMTYPGLKKVIIDGDPLVIHIAKNISLFSLELITELNQLSADFCYQVEGVSYETVLREFLDNHQINEDEYGSYLAAAGIDTDSSQPEYIPWDVQEYKPKTAMKRRLKELFANFYSAKDVVSAENRLAIEIHEATKTKKQFILEGKQRLCARRRSLSTEHLATSEIAAVKPNKFPLRERESVWEPPVKKTQVISTIQYKVKLVATKVISKFHKVKEDEMGLMINREFIALDEVDTAQELLHQEVHRFFPVIEVTREQKEKAEKKFMISTNTHEGRKAFKSKQKALRIRSELETDEFTEWYLPKGFVPLGSDLHDDVFVPSRTQETYQQFYSYAKRASIVSLKSDCGALLLPKASCSDSDIGATEDISEPDEPIPLKVFLPVLTKNEASEHAKYIQKYTTEEIVACWKGFSKLASKGEDKWQKAKQANRESRLNQGADSESNKAKKRWQESYKQVSKSLEKLQTSRESMSDKFAQYDADFSEKLAELKVDERISHSEAAILHGIEAFGNFLPIVKLYREWSVSTCSEALETGSAALSIALGTTSSAAETASHLVTDLKDGLTMVSGVTNALNGLQEGVMEVVTLLKQVKNSNVLNKVKYDNGFKIEEAEELFQVGESFSSSLLRTAKSLTDSASSVLELLESEGATLGEITPVLGLCLYSLSFAKRSIKLAHDIHDYCKTSEIKHRLKDGLADFPVLAKLVDEKGKTIEANLKAVVFDKDTLGQVSTQYQQCYAERYYAIREIKEVNGKRINRQIFYTAMDGFGIAAEIAILTGMLAPVALGLAGSVVAAKSIVLAVRVAKQEIHNLLDDDKSKTNKKAERIKVVTTLMDQLGMVLLAYNEDNGDQDIFLAQLVELDICFTAAGLPLTEFIKVAVESNHKKLGSGLTEAAKALYTAFEARE